ncbi:F0F1 ATP synthase subunit delta [Nocardioides sp. SYSU D00065]|uniref:F0F1 ATP synthase subunit delta n=1 Tax=Nocardioides sp. SYSU D00065 TaxID=2817378 RepID=UPI001B3220A7|nr:F0F1 ATP synthase subunit delta [Nocardioides sp. SYSU D00065]
MAFRGASVDAVASLSDHLQGELPGSDGTHVGSGLFLLASVLGNEAGLRRVLTDVSVAPAAKAGLAREVFGGKVSEVAVRLLERAVTLRWAATRHLPDALEHLGVIAVVRSAAEKGQSGQLADELFAFAQTVKGSPELRDALADPARSLDDKRTLVSTLLEGRTLPETSALAVQALAGTHRTVVVALTEYQKVAAEVHGRHVATVRVAQPLTDTERQRLGEALTRRTGRPVHINVVVEPSLIGGIRVEIGDEVIDGTVASRLDDVRRRLAS